jgi:hypothetical protein
MSGGYISFFNGSTIFSDAELGSALPDFQAQVSNEFNWYWGMNAYLDIGGSGTPIVIVDYPGANDPPGALGYHSIDGNYQPFAVIFAGLCRDNGYYTTGVISHELLELLADQLVDTVNLYDFGDGTGIIVIQEVCDPVEASLYYEGAVNNTVVSDFATPAWWVPGDPNQVDFLGVLGGPWQIASGGYISYQNITLSGWQQVFGEKLEQDMARAEKAIRNRVAVGNPRGDVVRQIQLRNLRTTQGRAQAGAGSQQQRGVIPIGVQPITRPGQQGPVRGQGQRERQAAGRQVPLGPRIQPAKRAEQVTIVKREEVPKVGDLPSGRQDQPGGDAQASRATSHQGSTRTTPPPKGH